MHELVNQRRLNWPLWFGFLLSLLAFPSYPLFFARFPATRDIPWANFVLFALGGALLFLGLRRAYREPASIRGKVLASIFGVVSLGVFLFFCTFIFYITKQLPSSTDAPRVGTRAPEFVLPDTQGRSVTLASLLKDPLSASAGAPKGVLLIFYRGYW